MKQIEVSQIRQDFPLLQNEPKLSYLDSAATAQKPNSVIEALTHFYHHDNANVHRGIYALSERASAAYEAARHAVANFVGAKAQEVIFVRGCTEAINLVAQTFVRARVVAGDEIILTEMEHHSNIVPWQLLAQSCGLTLRVVSVDEQGDLDLSVYRKLFSPRTKMVALTHMSNTLGTVNPVEDMIALAREQHVPILLDGAQSVVHMPIDFKALDCDFYTFSGHKLYGPTGIGVLVAKQAHFDDMPPYQGGGGMISKVSFEHGTTYQPGPMAYEAGTPSIADAVGLHAAVDYLGQFAWEDMMQREDALLHYMIEGLQAIDGVKLLGSPKHHKSVQSFTCDYAHPHDIATVLDNKDVAVRAGHHCNMPLMTRYGLPATVRVSLGIYNRHEDIDQLLAGMRYVKEIFG